MKAGGNFDPETLAKAKAAQAEADKKTAAAAKTLTDAEEAVKKAGLLLKRLRT